MRYGYRASILSLLGRRAPNLVSGGETFTNLFDTDLALGVEPMWQQIVTVFKDPAIAAIASWVQALIYLVTLVVLIVQARILIRQTKSQERAVRLQTEAIYHAEYARCESDYSALIRMMVEQPALQTIYDDLAKIGPSEAGWLQYDSRHKLLFNYIELNYDLFERIYYLWQGKWIDAATWSTWEQWLQYLARHPVFTDVRRGNRGMFGEDFERYVDHLVGERQTDTQL
jgi:hypothetical protein